MREKRAMRTHTHHIIYTDYRITCNKELPLRHIQTAPHGPFFSQFIAGFWRLDSWDLSKKETLSLIEYYLDNGVSTMDHADIYGGFANEKLFGDALAIKPDLRNKMEIVTKCDIAMMCDAFPDRKTNYYDTSADYITTSVENSLQNFKTDHIDLLLIHRPDPLMNADEVAETFSELKKSGKVLHFGVSNFTPHQFDLLQSRLETPLATNQVEINPINKHTLHDGTLDQCQKLHMSPMAWSPLAGGELFWGNNKQVKRITKTLKRISDELNGATYDQILYAWLLKLPAKPLPIIGTGNRDRIASAIASEHVWLTREQWFAIWEAAEGNPVP